MKTERDFIVSIKKEFFFYLDLSFRILLNIILSLTKAELY